jgi:amino acid transporter
MEGRLIKGCHSRLIVVTIGTVVRRSLGTMGVITIVVIILLLVLILIVGIRISGRVTGLAIVAVAIIVVLLVSRVARHVGGDVLLRDNVRISMRISHKEPDGNQPDHCLMET